MKILIGVYACDEDDGITAVRAVAPATYELISSDGISHLGRLGLSEVKDFDEAHSVLSNLQKYLETDYREKFK